MEYSEYNETDLAQACKEAGFPTAHRGLGVAALFGILEGTVEPPPRVECRMERHRRGMAAYCEIYGTMMKSQLGCDINCPECKDPTLSECTVFNWELTHRKTEVTE